MRVIATLFADAAWCPETGLAGWAARIKRGVQRPRRFGGVLPGTVASADEAELAALVAGLVRLEEVGWSEKPGRGVRVYADAPRALDLLLTQIPGSRERPHAGGLSVAGHGETAVVTAVECRLLEAVVAVQRRLYLRLVLTHCRRGPPDAPRVGNRIVGDLDRIARARLRETLAEARLPLATSTPPAAIGVAAPAVRDLVLTLEA